MRSSGCDEIGVLIDREAFGWSEAERLKVEDHLSACARCGEALALSRYVRRTLLSAAEELPEAARTRALSAALRGHTARQHGRSKTRRFVGGGMIALGVAAAAAVALVWLSPDPAAPKPVAQRAAEKPAAVATVAPPPAQAEATPPEPTAIETSTREERTLAHAHVRFEPESRARFDAKRRRLLLEQGRVEVDVDARLGESFSVVTQHFRVEVLGTQFSVTPEQVSVTRGRVQVFGTDGRVLARELAAGSTFTYGEKSTRAPARTKSASTLLAEARMALARGDSARARELVSEAERAHPVRTERAEAGTLRAESALLEQKSTLALRAYREVAERFPDLSAGDNAAFAAAQLATKADPAAERALLESYLTHFPEGRFREEVQTRLARLKRR